MGWPQLPHLDSTHETLDRAPAQTVAQGLPGAQPQGVVRNIQVVADRDNNTLLVVATPAEWIVIESALKKLDVPARQVMIEMVIAEVSLTDDFQFGVEWYFKNGSNQAGGNFRRGTVPGDIFGAIAGTAANIAGVGIGARVPGFNYLLSGVFPGGVQAALSLLGTAGNTKIVANPHVAALDNQKSTIKVGDRIPISQQTIVGGTSNAVTTTSQYIDTGVLVAVTPRINAGGLVTLDIQAEVSNPGDAPAGTAPPINTRSLQSMVAVQSGDTLIMGGLIRDTKQQASEGIPWLTKIPILGGLFGQQEVKDQRSELVLFVTPRVVETAQDMRGIIDDLRRRMDRLDSTLIPPLRLPAEQLPQGTTVFPPLSTMGGAQPMGGPRALIQRGDDLHARAPALHGIGLDEILRGERRWEHEDKGEHFHRLESSYGKFERSFSLSERIDVDGITAAMERGVLKLVLPKRSGTGTAKQIRVETD